MFVKDFQGCLPLLLQYCVRVTLTQCYYTPQRQNSEGVNAGGEGDGYGKGDGYGEGDGEGGE